MLIKLFENKLELIIYQMYTKNNIKVRKTLLTIFLRILNKQYYNLKRLLRINEEL
jgi:hypothetical protein